MKPLNKLMIFPLAFMFILSVYAMVDTGLTYQGASQNYSDSDQFEINETGSSKTGAVKIPRAGTQTFDLWDGSYAIAIILAAISIGIVAGIKVLGSGLNELAQSLIFNSVLFLGLWACVSAISGDYLFDNAFMTMFWIGITVTYVIGLGQHLNGGGSGE